MRKRRGVINPILSVNQRYASFGAARNCLLELCFSSKSTVKALPALQGGDTKFSRLPDFLVYGVLRYAPVDGSPMSNLLVKE